MQLQHLYTTFPQCHTCSWQGFTVEGKIGDGSDADDYIDKCVYVDGGHSGLDGFVMEDLLVQNCG